MWIHTILKAFGCLFQSFPNGKWSSGSSYFGKRGTFLRQDSFLNVRSSQFETRSTSEKSQIQHPSCPWNINKSCSWSEPLACQLVKVSFRTKAVNSPGYKSPNTAENQARDKIHALRGNPWIRKHSNRPFSFNIYLAWYLTLSCFLRARRFQIHKRI